LTGSAQIFSDVRTYWSPEAVQRVTGWKPTGLAEHGFLHLINSGATCLDGTGCERIDGKPAMKPWWQVEPEEAKACLNATQWRYARSGLLPRWRLFLRFATEGGMPITMARINLVKA